MSKARQWRIELSSLRRIGRPVPRLILRPLIVSTTSINPGRHRRTDGQTSKCRAKYVPKRPNAVLPPHSAASPPNRSTSPAQDGAPYRAPYVAHDHMATIHSCSTPQGEAWLGRLPSSPQAQKVCSAQSLVPPQGTCKMSRSPARSPRGFWKRQREWHRSTTASVP